MKWLIKITPIVLALCLISTQAFAHYQPPRKKGGTFFIAEVHSGATWLINCKELSPQFTLATTLGFGGKFSNFPMRFYLIGRLGWNYASVHGTDQNPFDMRRNTLEYSVGLRLLMPIIKGLRIYADFMLGGTSYLSSMKIGNTYYIYKDRSTHGTAFFGGGVQYRFAEWLSVGMHTDVGIPLVEVRFNPLLQMVSITTIDSAKRVNLLGTLTFHF
jgi:hypothetical protein